MAPALYGAHCEGSVCVESEQSFQKALALHEEGLNFIAERVVRLEKPRRMIFCESTACADYFGPLGKRRGQTTGPFGTVIGPEGWVPYIVLHELIHQVQNEQMGTYRLRPGPDWFLEGMAYVVSEDPRVTIGEPWDGYRTKYQEWAAGVPAAEFWARARELR